MIRLMNYYRTKFESKVDAMVQSSMASSQQTGCPRLLSEGIDGQDTDVYTFHEDNFDLLKGSTHLDELDDPHADYSMLRKKKGK